VLLLGFNMERDLIQDFITLAFYVMPPFSLVGFPFVSDEEGLHAYSSMIVTLCHNLPHMELEE
jgi:hypothetical protein